MMTQQELTVLNIGQNLDDLMNLDPRGYGVCRILYPAARAYTGAPLCTNAAAKLCETLTEGDLVYIMTGFVLLPFKKAEMDGIISSILLARALVKAFGARPVIICPTDNLEAVHNLANVVGLHLYDTVEDVLEYPISLAVVPFTKDADKAEAEADALIAKKLPKAVISIECPGANAKGVYHNATGLDVTELEAKTDVLFEKLQKAGVLNIAIGDLGNEIGMGTILKHIKKYVPYAAEGAHKSTCRCGCNGGIAAVTHADHIITATVSDWGCYGLIAALAFLRGDLDIMHNAEMERSAIHAASRSGMIDMYGWLVPAIDGMDCEMNVTVVTLMRSCIKSAMQLTQTCETWFEKVIERGFYANVTGGE